MNTEALLCEIELALEERDRLKNDLASARQEHAKIRLSLDWYINRSTNLAAEIERLNDLINQRLPRSAWCAHPYSFNCVCVTCLTSLHEWVSPVGLYGTAEVRHCRWCGKRG